MNFFTKLFSCCKTSEFVENEAEAEAIINSGAPVERRNEESKGKKAVVVVLNKEDDKEKEKEPSPNDSSSVKIEEKKENVEREIKSKAPDLTVAKTNTEKKPHCLLQQSAEPQGGAQKTKTTSMVMDKKNFQLKEESGKDSKERKPFDYSLCPKAPKPRNQKHGTFNIQTIKVPQTTPLVYNPSSLVINTIIRPVLQPNQPPKQKMRIVRSSTTIEKSKKKKKNE